MAGDDRTKHVAMQATGTCSASGQYPISLPTFQLSFSPKFVCCHLASSVSLILLLIACQAHADVLTYPKLLLSEFPLSSHCLQCEVKCLPTMRKTWVQSLDREDLLEKEMATHSSILAWKIPWMEDTGRLHTVHGVAESDTTERLHFLSFFHIANGYFSASLLYLPISILLFEGLSSGFYDSSLSWIPSYLTTLSQSPIPYIRILNHSTVYNSQDMEAT